MTTQEGEKGTGNIQWVSYVEVGRTVLDSVVTKEPVESMLRSAVQSLQLLFRAEVGSLLNRKWKLIIPARPAMSVKWPPNKGMDIASGYGNPIYASAGGTVILARWYSGYGKCVMIDHGNGIVTLYGHASNLYVSRQVVARANRLRPSARPDGLLGNHTAILKSGSTVKQ